jgi:hypothetical protein
MSSGAEDRRAARDLERFGAGRVRPSEDRLAMRLARRGRKYRVDADGKRVALPYVSGKVRATSYAHMKDGSYAK